MTACPRRQKAWLCHCVQTVCSSHRHTEGDMDKKHSGNSVFKMNSRTSQSNERCASVPRDTLPSTFFRYDEWKPNIDCSTLNTGPEYIGISAIAALFAGTQWALCRDQFQALDTARTLQNTVPESISSHTLQHALSYYVTSPFNSLNQGCQYGLYATLYTTHFS